MGVEDANRDPRHATATSSRPTRANRRPTAMAATMAAGSNTKTSWTAPVRESRNNGGNVTTELEESPLAVPHASVGQGGQQLSTHQDPERQDQARTRQRAGGRGPPMIPVSPPQRPRFGRGRSPPSWPLAPPGVAPAGRRPPARWSWFVRGLSSADMQWDPCRRRNQNQATGRGATAARGRKPSMPDSSPALGAPPNRGMTSVVIGLNSPRRNRERRPPTAPGRGRGRMPGVRSSGSHGPRMVRLQRA